MPVSKQTPLRVVPGPDAPGRAVPTPDQPNIPTEEPVSREALRGRFAVSLCRAHRIGADDGSAPCQAGISCAKQNQCLDLADKTLAYAQDLKDGRLYNSES